MATATRVRNRVVRPSSSLKPVLKAYILAYLSVTTPKIFRVLVAFSRKQVSITELKVQVRKALKLALLSNQFPAFAGVLAGGFVYLQKPLYLLLSSLSSLVAAPSQGRNDVLRRIARFFAALTAANIAFGLFNGPAYGPKVKASNGKNVAFALEVTSDDEDEDLKPFKKSRTRLSKIPPGLPKLPAEATIMGPPSMATKGVPLAGHTMDLTVFAVVRAADALIQLMRNPKQPPRGRIATFIKDTTTPALFIWSSAIIMHAWFYTPYRLPASYVRWIERIAETDERLMYALKQAKYGNWVYGKNTGMAKLLGSLAKECGLPEVAGDPERTIPVPCSIVHAGVCDNCELHAAWRFLRGWRKALGVYLPLQLIVIQRRMRQGRCGRGRVLGEAAVSAARNSAFLGAFVALFYYGVCLTRTRLVPKLFSPKTVTPQMLDGGLCVLGGCALCGFSVLLENARRQTELMLFVLPRAVGVWFPRRYSREYLYREQAAFALSAAIVITTAAESPSNIRGVLGRILKPLVGA